MQVITHIDGKQPTCTALVDVNLKAKGMYCASSNSEQIDSSEKPKWLLVSFLGLTNLETEWHLTPKGTRGSSKIKSTWIKQQITCFKCNEAGHYSNKCSNVMKSDNGKQFLTCGNDDEDDEEFEDDEKMTIKIIILPISYEKRSHRVLPNHWILLDDQSTVDIFHNRDLLTNIRETGKQNNIDCNAGIMTTTLMGYLPGYGRCGSTLKV